MWLDIREGQREHLAQPRANGERVTLKQLYLGALSRTAGCDVMKVGLPLRQLNQLF